MNPEIFKGLNLNVNELSNLYTDLGNSMNISSDKLHELMSTILENNEGSERFERFKDVYQPGANEECPVCSNALIRKKHTAYQAICDVCGLEGGVFDGALGYHLSFDGFEWYISKEKAENDVVSLRQIGEHQRMVFSWYKELFTKGENEGHDDLKRATPSMEAFNPKKDS